MNSPSVAGRPPRARAVRFLRAAACAAGLFSPAALRSEEWLTWDACLAEAARHNPDLAAARLAVGSARARLGAKTGEFLPQVTASASAGVSGGDEMEDDRGYSMGLSARQSLFSGFRTKADRDRAASSFRQAGESLRSASAGVLFDLESAFARLLYAQEQEAVARVIEARRRENVRLVELRFQAGREHQGSFLRSRASHRQAQYDLSQSMRARRLARRELSVAMGRSAFDVFSATGALQGVAPGEAPDYEALAEGLPAVRLAEESLVSARASLTIARAAFWPDLSATGSLSRTGDRWAPDRDRWSAGLNLSYPLFSGGSDAWGARAARLDREAAAARLRSARLAAALGLEDAFAGWQDAVERAEVQKAFLEAAQVRARIARSQYENGLLTFDDWDIIENDLISQEKNALASRRDAVLAEAAWDRTLAKGIDTP